AVAVGDLLDRAPIFGPLHFGELLQRAHLAESDLGLVQLRIERADIGEGQDPVLHDAMQFCDFARRAAAVAKRSSSARSGRRIARSQDGKVREPTRLVATVKCSPPGPTKNGQSVAPRIAGSSPSSASFRSTCARSLTAINVAAIATSMY